MTIRLLIVLSVMAVAMGARAQQPPDALLESYRQVAFDGQAAFNRGDYAEARRLWEHARSLLPNPRVYRLLGRAAAAMAEHADAVRMFRLALSAPDNGNPLTPALREEVENVLLPHAMEHVGEIMLELEPADASVAIDGRPVPIVDSALLLSVGTHTLSARRRGYRAREVVIDVRPHARESLRVALVRVSRTHPPGPARTPAPRRERPTNVGTTTPDLAGPALLFAVGVAGFAGFATGGALALAENDRLSVECGTRAPGVACSHEQLGDLHTYAIVADVGWVSAAVATAAAITWLAVALTNTGDAPSAQMRVAPWASADAGGLMLAGSLEGDR